MGGVAASGGLAAAADLKAAQLRVKLRGFGWRLGRLVGPTLAGDGGGGRLVSDEGPCLVQPLPCCVPLLRNWGHSTRRAPLGRQLGLPLPSPCQSHRVRPRLEWRWLTCIRTVEWPQHQARTRLRLDDITVLGGRRDPPCDIGLEVVEVADGHLWLGFVKVRVKLSARLNASLRLSRWCCVRVGYGRLSAHL